MTRSLVTGADGFVGQHLVAELLRRGEVVVGAVRELPPALNTLSETDAARVRWVLLELERPETVREVMGAHQVDRVFHLAGLSSVAESHADPVAPLRVNTIGTLYVLNELAELRRKSGYDPRVLITGSSQVYGRAALRCQPLTEDSPLEPLSPYAVSKAAQEMLAIQFSRAHELDVVVTRSFNHTGPGQRPTFVASQLATRIKEIRSSGDRGTVGVGNPEVRRDFTDVRDVVRAYILLSDRGRAGTVYNVCSGRAYAVGELLETLAELGEVEIDVQIDPQLRRGVDIPEMVGSYARLSAATGWEPQIAIRDSLAALLAGV